MTSGKFAAPTGTPVRDAATLALLRAGATGTTPQVLLLGRPASASFAPSTQVFPGGALDESDREPGWHQLLPSGTEAGWDPRADLPVRIAAIRETYEECGVLLARDSGGLPGNPQQLAELELTRARMRRREPGLLLPALTRAGLLPAVDEIVFCAHWVTPEGLPKRFDTRFFLAALPPGQEPSPDPLGEHESLRWVGPAQALEEASRGECQLLPPTRAVLAWLADSTGVEDALRRARGSAITTVRPDLGDVTAARYPGLDLSTLHRE